MNEFTLCLFLLIDYLPFYGEVRVLLKKIIIIKKNNIWTPKKCVFIFHLTHSTWFYTRRGAEVRMLLMLLGHFWTFHVQRDASASEPLSRYISKIAKSWSESTLYENNQHGSI